MIKLSEYEIHTRAKKKTKEYVWMPEGQYYIVEKTEDYGRIRQVVPVTMFSSYLVDVIHILYKIGWGVHWWWHQLLYVRVDEDVIDKYELAPTPFLIGLRLMIKYPKKYK